MQFKQTRLRQLWSETRWILLGIVWLLGLILGYAGFSMFSRDNAFDWNAGDTLYRTLQLIILESGSVTGQINWMLETARFLLPALTAYTAFQALMHLFQEQMQWLRLWGLRGHVIISGLGRKGSHLASKLLELGQRVVIIEKDPEQTKAKELRRQGAIILTGDATDQDILTNARLHRARHLICLLGEDSQNLQVAFQAYQLTHPQRKGVLTCIVHFASPDLLNLIKRSELSIEADIPFQIETFHPYARSAQLLIHEDPGWQDSSDPSNLPDHLLVIGLGRFGEHLVAHAAYTWHRLKLHRRLLITILDLKAIEKTEILLSKQPQIEKVCQLIPLQVDLGSTNLLYHTLENGVGQKQIQRVYICLSDPVLSLQVCLSLLQIPDFRRVPIRVRLEQETRLPALLETPMTGEPFCSQFIPFDMYERTCSAELVVGGLHELLARELHEQYLRGIEVSATHQQSSPYWDQLPDDEKEANRQQASRIYRLLNAAGYRINPLQDWDASEFIFRTDEVDQMAQLEHDLWRQAKLASGWQSGPVKDKKKRTHPALTAWEKLPDEDQKKNRAFIHQLPSLLARLGFQIDGVQ
jgi:hypothetical protein